MVWRVTYFGAGTGGNPSTSESSEEPYWDRGNQMLCWVYSRKTWCNATEIKVMPTTGGLIVDKGPQTVAVGKARHKITARYNGRLVAQFYATKLPIRDEAAILIRQPNGRIARVYGNIQLSTERL